MADFAAATGAISVLQMSRKIHFYARNDSLTIPPVTAARGKEIIL